MEKKKRDLLPQLDFITLLIFTLSYNTQIFYSQIFYSQIFYSQIFYICSYFTIFYSYFALAHLLLYYFNSRSPIHS